MNLTMVSVNLNPSVSSRRRVRVLPLTVKLSPIVSRRHICLSSSPSASVQINKAPPSPIQLTDGALKHLRKLKSERNEEKTSLRVGVKSGGCR